MGRDQEKEESVQALRQRLDDARRERDRCAAANGHDDEYLCAFYHARLLERCLAMRVGRPR